MRKSPLRRRTPLTSGGRIKPKRRKPSEFARIYGSKERVAWVKGIPCVNCFRLPSDNAHTEGDGMGRKAGYETIVPLCHECHQKYDEHRFPFNLPEYRQEMIRYASVIEYFWQAKERR